MIMLTLAVVACICGVYLAVVPFVKLYKQTKRGLLDITIFDWVFVLFCVWFAVIGMAMSLTVIIGN